MPIKQKYIPKIISLNPFRIISFHNILEVRFGLVIDYRNRVSVPPIPVIHAPKDLKHFGDYVNYNGHHRTAAARAAKIHPSGILLENWQDIAYLRDNPPKYKGEIYPELMEGLEDIFEAHRDFIWDEARRFYNLRKIAERKILQTT